MERVFRWRRACRWCGCRPVSWSRRMHSWRRRVRPVAMSPASSHTKIASSRRLCRKDPCSEKKKPLLVCSPLLEPHGEHLGCKTGRGRGEAAAGHWVSRCPSLMLTAIHKASKCTFTGRIVHRCSLQCHNFCVLVHKSTGWRGCVKR